MAFSLTQVAALTWRDFNTDGVSASGKWSPRKSEIRTWGTEIEEYLDGTTPLDQVDIDGGAIDGTPVGANARSTGAFTTLALTTPLPVASGGTASATESAARTALGLEIGTDVQAFHALLSALAGVAPVADDIPYFTGATTIGKTPTTAFTRALFGDADATAARARLQALFQSATLYSGSLNDIAVSGLYKLDAGVTNGFAGAGANDHVFAFYSSATKQVQIGFDDGGSMYKRTNSSGWGNWQLMMTKELCVSISFSDIGVNALHRIGYGLVTDGTSGGFAVAYQHGITITRSSTGVYAVAFANARANTNYMIHVTAGEERFIYYESKTVNGFEVRFRGTGAALADVETGFSIFIEEKV